jgi:hypothetical protein
MQFNRVKGNGQLNDRLFEGGTMFSNLNDQIQQTNGQVVSRTRQLLRVLGVVCVTTVLFGSLYFGIRLLE